MTFQPLKCTYNPVRINFNLSLASGFVKAIQTQSVCRAVRDDALLFVHNHAQNARTSNLRPLFGKLKFAESLLSVSFVRCFWWKSRKTWDEVSERACKTLREQYWMLSQGPPRLTMFDSYSGSNQYLSGQSEPSWPWLNLRPVKRRKRV